MPIRIPTVFGLISALALILPVLLPSSALAACNPAIAKPAYVTIGAGDRLLCFGDSISKGLDSRPAHYAKLLEVMLQDAYCELAAVEVDARGSNSGHWRSYRNRLSRILSKNDFDIVIVQDAGKAKKRKGTRFQDYVEDTLRFARASRPGVVLYPATTPTLDTHRAGGKWIRVYAAAENFLEHNKDVVQVADDQNVSVAEWAESACSVFAARPDLAWTRDGVHLADWGEYLLALSSMRTLGVPRDHLRFDGLLQFSPNLNPSDAAAVADIVYSPAGECSGDAESIEP